MQHNKIKQNWTKETEGKQSNIRNKNRRPTPSHTQESYKKDSRLNSDCQSKGLPNTLHRYRLKSTARVVRQSVWSLVSIPSTLATLLRLLG